MIERDVEAATAPATLLGWIRDAGYGDRPAIRADTTTLSYAELIGLVDATAAQLESAILPLGARVLLILPNSVEHIVALLAVGALGGFVRFSIPTPPKRPPAPRRRIRAVKMALVDLPLRAGQQSAS